jgi:hypothetical protein
MTLAVDDAARPARAPHAARATRSRWPYLGFVLIAAVFGWQLLLQGRILLPTNPATLAPWFGDVPPESAAVPSNGLMMDTLIFTWPARIYNAEMLGRGEVPFWNPAVFAGYPHLAMIQNNVLYPPSTLFDVIEPVSGMGFSILLHLALAGALMFAFLRSRGLADDAAFLGAAAFELNGMFLIRMSAPSYVFSGTWLPLLLLGASRAARGGLRAGWPVTLATALSVLGGHPQITSLCLTLAGVFLLIESASHAAASETARIARVVARVAAFGLLVVLGVALAGYQVVPFLELMANSARGSVPLEAYRNAAMPVTGLLQALVPDAFGHPIEMDYWLPDTAHLVDGRALRARPWALNFSGENVYTGLVPPVLAVVAVLRAPARRDVLLFAGASLAALGILLGTPLIDLAYAVVPGFRYSRPDRILFVYMAGMSVLTAHGYAALRGGAGAPGAAAPARAKRLRAGAPLVLAAGLLIVAWPLVPRLATAAGRADLAAWLADARGQWLQRSALLLPELLWTTAVLAVLVVLASRVVARRVPATAAFTAWTLLLLAPLLWFGWRFNPMQVRPVLGATTLEKQIASLAGDRTTRVARILPELPQAMPANVLQLLGVDDIHGASAAGVGGYLDLIDAAEPGSVAAHKYFRAFRDAKTADGRILDLLNAGFVLANVALPPPYEPVGGEDGLTLYRNPDALPRFFLVSASERYATPEEGRARLLAADFDPATRVLLPAGETAPLPVSSAPGGASSPGRVEVLSRSAHAIRLRVTTPQDAILVSSEVYYPGWTTRVDGADAPTLLVDTAFRGTIVPAGTHDVEMVYVPRSFRIGAGVSLAALLVAILLWWPRARAHARPATA